MSELETGGLVGRKAGICVEKLKENIQVPLEGKSRETGQQVWQTERIKIKEEYAEMIKLGMINSSQFVDVT